MRKNVKKQLALRVLSTAALMAMVSSIATAAFADTYDLNTGSVTVETKDNGTTYVTQENTDIKVRPDTTGVTITSNGKQTSNTITVETADKQTTNVTLQDVNIAVDTVDTKSGAIEIKGDGKTNLELNGNNTVLVQNNWSEEHAAIEKADKYGHGTLTIKDDVNDNGKPKTGTKADTTGTLVAGGYHDAAAIGGGEGNLPILPILPSPVVRSLPAAALTVPVSAAVTLEMHRISALRAMQMLSPLETVVLPLDPVIIRESTVILPSPIMPL